MSEALHDTPKSKPSLGIRAARAAFAGAVLVGTAGCTTEVNSQDAPTVAECNPDLKIEYSLEARTSDTPVEDINVLEQNVRNGLAVIYRRVEAIGGEKKFHDGPDVSDSSPGDGYSVTTNSDMLTITLPRDYSGYFYTEVQVGIVEGQPQQLDAGTLVCMQDSNLYPNGLPKIVSDIQVQTQGLDALLR